MNYVFYHSKLKKGDSALKSFILIGWESWAVGLNKMIESEGI